MDTIFLNPENSKTYDPHSLLFNLLDKKDLKRKSIKYTWKTIKKSYKPNKFKVVGSTWNEIWELPDGSYSVSDFQDYFIYIVKKHEPVRVYVNKIENRIPFRIKTGYYLELLTPETMKLPGRTKSQIT